MSRTGKVLALWVCILGVVGGLVYGARTAWHSAVGDGHIRITQAQVSELLQKQLPKTHKNITVTRGEVELRGSIIALRMHAEGTRLKQAFSVDISAEGVPSYKERGSGEFYFKPVAGSVKIENLALKGEGIAEKGERFAKRVFRSQTTQETVGDLAREIERWVLENSGAAVEHILTQRPIYKLKDTVRDTVIHASLEKVEVRDGEIHVHVSLVKLTTTLMIWALCFVLVVVLAIAMVRTGAFPLLFVF